MPGGVKTPQQFWDVMINERDMITDIPADRWSIETWYDSDQTNYTKMITKRAGFIHDIDKFDNTFFKVREEQIIMILDSIESCVRVITAVHAPQ